MHLAFRKPMVILVECSFTETCEGGIQIVPQKKWEAKKVIEGTVILSKCSALKKGKGTMLTCGGKRIVKKNSK